MVEKKFSNLVKGKTKRGWDRHRQGPSEWGLETRICAAN